MAGKTLLVVLSLLAALAAAEIATNGSATSVDPGSDPTSDRMLSSSAADSEAAPACDQQLGDMACGIRPAAPAFNAASTVCPSSPFAPPEVSDTDFVADCAGGLDTGCTFRDGGPL